MQLWDWILFNHFFVWMILEKEIELHHTGCFLSHIIQVHSKDSLHSLIPPLSSQIWESAQNEQREQSRVLLKGDLENVISRRKKDWPNWGRKTNMYVNAAYSFSQDGKRNKPHRKNEIQCFGYFVFFSSLWIKCKWVRCLPPPGWKMMLSECQKRYNYCHNMYLFYSVYFRVYLFIYLWIFLKLKMERKDGESNGNIKRGEI